MKLDIADGFYCVGLVPEDVPSLGVCLPLGQDGKNLVAFPLILLMGWVEYLPQFCAVTETVVNLTNTALREQTPRLCTPHQLDQVLESTVPGLGSPISGHLDINHNRVVKFKGALAYIDIFVDDFRVSPKGIRRGDRKSSALYCTNSTMCCAPSRQQNCPCAKTLHH